MRPPPHTYTYDTLCMLAHALAYSHPPAPMPTAEPLLLGIRAGAALSMAYQNMTILGCTYPTAVEEAVGDWAPRKDGGSGMAAEGEMRAAAEARGI